MTTVAGLGWPVDADWGPSAPPDAHPTGLGWPGARRGVPRGTPPSSASPPAAHPVPAEADDVAPSAPVTAPDPADPAEETESTDEPLDVMVVAPGPAGADVDPDPAAVPVVVVPTVQPASAVPAAPVEPTAEPLRIAPRSARHPVGSGSRPTFRHVTGTRVLAVANQKGGVGKTTSVVNLGAALAQNGVRTLVIDLDPQGNASTALGIEHPAGTPSIYDVLIGGAPIADVLTTSAEFPLLEVVPATIDLAGAEIELVPMVARESRLRRALRAHLRSVGESDSRPEVVLVDCPPSLGLITLNALVAARELLVPIQCEYYALEGLGQLVQTVEMVTQHLNEVLEITTILLTMYDARTRLSGQVADEVRRYFGDRVLATVVPRSVRISEAPSYQQTVLTFDPTSSGALSYVEAARELAASRHAAPLAGAEAGSSAPSWGALG